MNLNIDNKVALISGSTQGIGFACAKKLVQEKVHVYINGRTKLNVDTAINKIKLEFPNAKISGIIADLSTQSGCNKLTKELPKIDILINNLGIFEPKNFTEINDKDWLDMFNTNVMSGVRLSRYYFPKMLEQNWGRIIFISSESAYQIPAEMIHYGMSKTAQLAISRGIAELTKGTNVTSNSIIVGPSNSEGVTTFLNDYAKEQNITFEEMEKSFFQTVRPTSLLQRFTDVEEIANLIVYTASSLSSATNGAVLRADAGVVQSAI
jgi:NAD(P)-dependent dehydrogenase (short-subunit alcohol dehydrogenase family)